MASPTHKFACATCNKTFDKYMTAFDHILLDPRHQDELEEIKLRVGQSGKWAAIDAKITVLLVADAGQSARIKNTAHIKNTARSIVPGPVSSVSAVHIDSYAHVSPLHPSFL